MGCMGWNQHGHPGCRSYSMRWILCFCAGFFAGAAWGVPAVVDHIVDGDTFGAHVLLDDDITVAVRVRLDNVDAPEIHGQCDSEITMALQARDRLAELLPIGTMVELRNVRDDKYLGRIDARVYDADGHDVSKILLNEKLARPYNGGRRASWCE